MTTVITVNGERRELEGGSTVADVAGLYPGARGLAIALNGEVVPRSAWDSTPVEPDDRLELLSVAPGG